MSSKGTLVSVRRATFDGSYSYSIHPSYTPQSNYSTDEPMSRLELHESLWKSSHNALVPYQTGGKPYYNSCSQSLSSLASSKTSMTSNIQQFRKCLDKSRSYLNNSSFLLNSDINSLVPCTGGRSRYNNSDSDLPSRVRDNPSVTSTISLIGLKGNTGADTSQTNTSHMVKWRQRPNDLTSLTSAPATDSSMTPYCQSRLTLLLEGVPATEDRAAEARSSDMLGGFVTSDDMSVTPTPISIWGTVTKYSLPCSSRMAGRFGSTDEGVPDDGANSSAEQLSSEAPQDVLSEIGFHRVSGFNTTTSYQPSAIGEGTEANSTGKTLESLVKCIDKAISAGEGSGTSSAASRSDRLLYTGTNVKILDSTHNDCKPFEPKNYKASDLIPHFKQNSVVRPQAPARE